MLDEYLAQWRGPVHSQGQFTRPSSLGLAEVPLLLLAGAVEGGSRFFRVSGSLRLSWEGSMGPCGQEARAILERERVDALFGEGFVALPAGFSAYLGPLRRRSGHAGLSMVWGSRVVPAWPGGVVVRRGGPRLTLVDRGLDFEVPFVVPGLSVVASVGVLPGAPWPRCLVWGDELKRTLSGVWPP